MTGCVGAAILIGARSLAAQQRPEWTARCVSTLSQFVNVMNTLPPDQALSAKVAIFASNENPVGIRSPYCVVYQR